MKYNKYLVWFHYKGLDNWLYGYGRVVWPWGSHRVRWVVVYDLLGELAKMIRTMLFPCDEVVQHIPHTNSQMTSFVLALHACIVSNPHEVFVIDFLNKGCWTHSLGLVIVWSCVALKIFGSTSITSLSKSSTCVPISDCLTMGDMFVHCSNRCSHLIIVVGLLVVTFDMCRWFDTHLLRA